jgi:hypothetical protein
MWAQQNWSHLWLKEPRKKMQTRIQKQAQKSKGVRTGILRRNPRKTRNVRQRRMEKRGEEMR